MEIGGQICSFTNCPAYVVLTCFQSVCKLQGSRMLAALKMSGFYLFLTVVLRGLYFLRVWLSEFQKYFYMFVG